MQNSNLVYSTDGGKIEQAKAQSARSVNKDGIVRIHRETKGRKGKGVSIVEGLDKEPAELKTLCKTLKQKCGCGGAVKIRLDHGVGQHPIVGRSFAQASLSAAVPEVAELASAGQRCWVAVHRCFVSPLHPHQGG